MVAHLIIKAEEMGWEVTLGEAWRSEEEARRLAAARQAHRVGIRRSLHCDRMAIDLNLFVDGVWLQSTEAHRELGEWWESVGGAWGGRFGDGNHYSLAHEGRK